MKKVIKLIILIIISSSVYFIYQQTNNSIINVTNIGDSLSLGINSYGIKEYGYIDYYKDYLIKENQKVNVINTYAKKDLSIASLLEQIKNTPKIKKDLTESNLLILTVGYNDLTYKLSIEDNLSNSKFEKIITNITNDYNDLIKEVRKYYKKEIISVGYYKSNKDDYFLNKGIRELNKNISLNEETTYIDTYTLLSNREKYFSNPHINYPNRLGYQAISMKIIRKTLEKEENIWYINNAFNYYDN